MNRISKDHQSEGFGLFSIRERLAALGGSLVIESIPGQGTDVELALPLGKRGIAENRSARPALSYAHHPLEDGSEKIATDHRTRVLVVDDHAVVRQGIANILDGDGRLLIVGEAADGVEAIEAVGARSPDVVLMDLNMPRMNGIEATREIRRRWPEVKVIGFSVQDYSATAGSMIDAGAAAFLSKAGDTEQMIASILSVAKSDGDGGNLPEGL